MKFTLHEQSMLHALWTLALVPPTRHGATCGHVTQRAGARARAARGSGVFVHAFEHAYKRHIVHGLAQRVGMVTERVSAAFWALGACSLLFAICHLDH